MILAPSILSADFGNIQSEVEMLNRSQADWIHVDIMDGVFVPNLSFGLPVCQAIKKHAKKIIDVHLMIVNPENYVEAFHKAGADIISVHYEACLHLHRNLQQIKGLGIKAGVAINPHTPIELLEYILCDTDLVCLMSVNPGFGGQKFIEKTYEKVRKLKAMIEAQGTNTLIEIDGGVTSANAKQLIEAGADVLVAGSFVFGAEKPEKVIAELKNLAN